MLEFYNQLHPYLQTALLLLGKALAVVIVLMTLCAYAVLAERKVAAWIQGRVGPNRTTLPLIGSIPVLGSFLTRLGIFQPLPDALKFLFKEEPVPAHVNRFYFVLAPILALVPALVTVTVVPFGSYVDALGEVQPLILANVDIGLLFLFAVSSLGVYSIILAGWSSNSKYPFLGGIRASAQLISYEIAMGLSVLPIFIWINTPGAMEATLSLVNIVTAQENLWFGITMPLAAFIFLVSVFAETNRAPFDMPESESELVGGFHTEYGAFKFGMFFVAEYAHMVVGSAVFTLLFLGGWHPLPFLSFPDLVELTGLSNPILQGALSISIFLVKTLAVVFLFMWVRWTVPRFRYDQVMNIGWRKLLPLAIANLVVYALLIAVHDHFFL
jgi:NADH-quinone oxidoreductase subunit H